MGYNIVDKKYVINEEEAGAIRLLFQMYDEGHGYSAIIRQLNALGYRTKAGNPFGKNSLYDLLHNEKYKGEYVYNKHTSHRPDGTRTRSNKQEEEIIRIPGAIPAIVDEAVWERVNGRLEKNKKNGGAFKAKEMYLLSGLIYCGECGYAMHGNGRYPAPDRPKVITYRCGHRSNNLACNNKEIKRDEVERFVIDQLQTYLCNESNIPKLTAELNQYVAQNSTGNDSDQQKYRKKQKELERNKANLVEAISQTGLQDVFAQKLAEIEAELKMVSSLLHRCEVSNQAATVTEDMVRGYLGSFREFVLKRDIPQIKKFIDSYMERVDVYKEKIVVTFKVALSDGLDEFQTLSYCFEKDTNRKALKTA